MSLLQAEPLLFWGYELLSALLPFLLALFLFARTCRRRGRALSAASCRLLLLFAVYVAGVYHFTGAATLYEALRYPWQPQNAFQLIPFSHRIDPVGYLLNVVLFVPLGLLVPVLWDRLRRFPSVLAAGLAFSLLVEATQLLNIRATDVDDLIMNGLGTAAGFGAYRLLDRRTKTGLRRAGIPAAALPLCVLVPYLGRFFLYNEMGLARLLYGF